MAQEEYMNELFAKLVELPSLLHERIVGAFLCHTALVYLLLFRKRNLN